MRTRKLVVLLFFLLICGLFTVCLGLLAVPLGVFGRLCYEIALPGHLQFYFSYIVYDYRFAL